MHTKSLPLFLIITLAFGILLPVPAASASPALAIDWDVIGQAGGPTQGIAVQGNYAYIGVGSRLVVVDISDPANPQSAGRNSIPLDYLVQGVTISGTHAYVAAGTAGLYIVDIARTCQSRQLLVPGIHPASPRTSLLLAALPSSQMARMGCAWWM